MIKTSIGVQELRTRIGHKAKTEPCHRFWGLYRHVWKMEVLREAYRLARENQGAPGVDGVTFKQIEEQGVEKLLKTLSQELQEQNYRALPCREVSIPKEGGKVRGLKIPAIRDRVVQGAVRLVMEPIFEADFEPGSFAYRPRRNVPICEPTETQEAEGTPRVDDVERPGSIRTMGSISRLQSPLEQNRSNRWSRNSQV